MPHIRIRSLPDRTVAELSKTLPSTLAPVMQTEIDNFTVESVATQFYRDGLPVDGDPMIEVLWFDRGQATKDSCAKKITEIAAKLTTSEYVAVVFTPLARADYYENGNHF